jgi:hypothetical protein
MGPRGFWGPLFFRQLITIICPEMNAHDFATLTEDIAAHGLSEAIVRHEGKILDGWERYKACRSCGVEPVFRDFDPSQEGDPRQFVLRMLFRRKHFDKTQRAMIAARLVTPKSVERALAILRTSTIVAEAVANGRIPSTRCWQRTGVARSRKTTSVVLACLWL